MKGDVADMQTSVEHAGEDHELKNNEFKQVVLDQRATQKRLTEALNVLTGYYDKAALVHLKGKKQPT